MELINKVFDDLGFVDYITVSEVTDSQVRLIVHLKSYRVPGSDSKEFGNFNDRCIVLGKILDRKVYFSFIPAQTWFYSVCQSIFPGLCKQ